VKLSAHWWPLPPGVTAADHRLTIHALLTSIGAGNRGNLPDVQSLALARIVVVASLAWVSAGAAGEPTASGASATMAPAWKQVRYGNPNALRLRSQVGLVIDEREGHILYARDIDKPRPIASLTKLLTAMTLLDAKLSLERVIEITREDRDRLKGSRSSLRFGTRLTRGDLMRIALVASDNRAAAALARTYPGGREALIRVMNQKAALLGLLARLAYVARNYPLINRWSTTRRFSVEDRESGKALSFRNTNSLVHRKRWDIAMSKTGFTSEAGNCLLMRTTIVERPLIVVLLNSWGKLSKYGDSGRIRDWLVASERDAKAEEKRARRAPAIASPPLQVTAISG
jgi:D-alanyl-D-alanine endopeptidase (penicillin-binding protein 7)